MTRSELKWRQEDTLGALQLLQARLSNPDRGKPRFGLCALIRGSGGSSSVLTTCFTSWGEWSGSLSYPVRSPKGDVDDMRAFHTLPLYSGEYGEARLRLLQHCIDTLTARLARPTTTLWAVGCDDAGGERYFEWGPHEGPLGPFASPL